MRTAPRAIRRLAVVAVVGFGAGLPVSADLVVLATGDFLKVSSYEVGETTVRLVLPQGGTLTLSLDNVVQFLDDELVAETTSADLDLSDLEIGFGAEPPVPETRFGELIFDVGRRYDLNPRLLAAMVAVESNFQPRARSHKGAIGLLQVMPATARRFGVEPGALYDPFVCLDVAARFLTHLRRRYDEDLTLVLAAYNAGETTVERFGGVPPYVETRDYLRKIRHRYGAGAG